MKTNPIQQPLGALERSATRVLERIRKREKPLNPLVIEFAGSPKAGKSTTIDILTHFFKRMGFKVWATTEGASKRTPYHLKRDLVAFNTWTLNYAISELLVAYYNVDHHDLVILDRGPFDSLSWMGLLCDRQELERHELDVIEQFATHPRWSNFINRVYLFECSPDTSLRRETDSKLTVKGGIAMNPKMLSDLLTQYDKMKAKLGNYPLKTVNTTRGTKPKQTSFELAMDILSLFESRLK